MTTLDGVVRAWPPKVFDGNAVAFTGLFFHLRTETFALRLLLPDESSNSSDTKLLPTCELRAIGHIGSALAFSDTRAGKYCS
jgi:hypothetical protein